MHIIGKSQPVSEMAGSLYKWVYDNYDRGTKLA